MRVRTILGLSFALLASFAAPPVASAGDDSSGQDIVQPSDKQLDLNNQAVRKIVKGDYAAAVALLEEALTLGKLNVTYLNLGRAYQKLERCKEAERALDRAERAPAVPQPSPDVIAQKIREYRKALSEVCPSIPSPTERARTRLSAEARTYGRRVASTAEAMAPSKQTATSGGKGRTPTSPTPTASPSETPSETSKPDTRRLWGWISIGAAGLFGGGSAALHLAASAQRSRVTDTPSGQVVRGVTQRDARRIQTRANRFDTYALVAAGVGTAALGTGLYLLVTPERPRQTRADDSNDDVRVRITGSNVSLSIAF